LVFHGTTPLFEFCCEHTVLDCRGFFHQSFCAKSCEAINTMATTPMETENDIMAQHGGLQSCVKRRTSMTTDQQKDRRASIREIMQDQQLTAFERRRSIQSLMDGRRRSSGGAKSLPGGIAGNMTMMAAAAAAAAEFYDSEDDSDVEANGGQTEQDNGVPSAESSLSSGRGGGVRSSDSSRTGGRRPSSQGFQRKGRSASLKAFASGAQAVAAAAAAAAAEFSENPEDVLHTAQRMEKSRPPCDHYARNCTLVSPCCGLAFGCRICHDDCPVLPPPSDRPPPKTWQNDAHNKIPKLEKRRSLPMDFQEEETHHIIDRFAIKEVICRQCYTRQSSKTTNCINCKIQFGDYHCGVCNLWMSASETPYHCIDCGFCRVGGRENFTHCHDCGMCIDALLFEDHNCKAGKYMSNCPVCQEDLFSSRSASHEMPCGHAIHWHCFRELTSFDTRCPVCKRTAETHDQMAPTWSAMAMGISLQPVPPEMARVVTVICNDCERQDDDRRWHFLGVQCLGCSSFNTTVERTVLVGNEAAAYLGDECTNGNGPHPHTHARNGHGVNGRHGASAMEDSIASFDSEEAEPRRPNHDVLLSTIQSRMDASMNDLDMDEEG